MKRGKIGIKKGNQNCIELQIGNAIGRSLLVTSQGEREAPIQKVAKQHTLEKKHFQLSNVTFCDSLTSVHPNAL